MVFGDTPSYSLDVVSTSTSVFPYSLTGAVATRHLQVGHQLCAIADTQYRDSQIKDFL